MDLRAAQERPWMLRLPGGPIKVTAAAGDGVTTDRQAQRKAIMGAVRAGKITAGRAAAYAKYVTRGGDVTDLFRSMPAAPRGPLTEREASTVLQALGAHLQMPKGTVAASGRLGDLEDDGVYAELYGSDPGRVTEHFASRRESARESAAAQAASLSDDELYDQLFPPRENN
jgi:hypothetical protein